MKSLLDSDQTIWRTQLYDFCQEFLHSKRIALRITQFYISSKLGLNQSEVSRIENGLTRPRDIPTFNLICSLYQLSPSVKSRYSSLIFGNHSESQLSLSVANFIRLQTQTVYELNRSGQTGVSMKVSGNLRLLMNDLIVQNRSNADIYNSLGRLTLEESIGLWDSSSPREARSTILGLIDSANKLCPQETTSVNSLPFYLSLTSAPLDYVSGKYKSAMNTFSNIEKFENVVDAQWKYESCRLGIICAAKNDDYKQFKFFERKIVSYLQEEDDLNIKSLLLEGLARSYAELMPAEALKMIGLCNSYLSQAGLKGSMLLVRQLQAKRSHSEILLCAGKLKQARDMATETVTMAQNLQLKRYKSQAIKLLKRVY